MKFLSKITKTWVLFKGKEVQDFFEQMKARFALSGLKLRFNRADFFSFNVKTGSKIILRARKGGI